MGVIDSGRPLLCTGALGAQAKLVLDPVLGLQHPAQAQAFVDPGRAPLPPPAMGTGALGILPRLRLKARGLV